MPDFSNALQGYLAGMQANSRLQTPVQAFLQQLRESQQQQLQREQAQGLMAFRKGMLGNTADRTAAMLQHYADMADVANRKAATSENRLAAWQNFQQQSLNIKNLMAQAQAGNQTARAKLADAQAAFVKSKQDLQDQFGADQAQSIINRNNAMADLSGARTGQIGEPSYGDVLKAFNAKQKAYDSLLPSQQKTTPKPTMQDAYQSLIQAKPASSATPGGQASLTPNADTLPPLPDSAIPQDTNPLLAMLKAIHTQRIPSQVSQSTGSATPPAAPPIPPGPTSTPTLPSVNYPLSPEPMPQGFVTPVGDIGDTFGQQASADPLHGMYSQRDPGVYQMNGKQYLVDGSGMIQALPV